MRYSEIILERIISIGLNPDHAKYINQYKDQLVTMISNAYSAAGGYSGLPSGGAEEEKAITNDLGNEQHSIYICTQSTQRIGGKHDYLRFADNVYSKP